MYVFVYTYRCIFLGSSRHLNYNNKSVTTLSIGQIPVLNIRGRIIPRWNIILILAVIGETYEEFVNC